MKGLSPSSLFFLSFNWMLKLRKGLDDCVTFLIYRKILSSGRVTDRRF